jgi:hypothetical protein
MSKERYQANRSFLKDFVPQGVDWYQTDQSRGPPPPRQNPLQAGIISVGGR